MAASTAHRSTAAPSDGRSPEEAGLSGRAPVEVTTWLVLRRVAMRYRPYRWHTVGSGLLVLITVGMSTAAPLLLQRIIDDALPRHDTTLLAVLCGLMMALGLVGSLLGVAETALTNWTGQRVAARLRVDVYDRARAQPLRFYSEQGQAQIQARLVSDIDGIDRFLTSTVHQALSALTALVAVGIAMIILSWPLALVSLALTALLSLFNNRFARRRRLLFRQRQRLLTTVLRYVSEDLSLSGVLLGRTLRRTRTQRDRFVEVAEDIRDVTFRQRIAGMSAYTVIGVSFACVPPLIFWAYGTFTPTVSVGAVVVLVMLQTRLSQPIQSLLRLSGGVQASVVMFERVLEYLDMDAPERDVAPVRRTPAGPAEVRLRGVSCRYPGSPAPALAGVDLDFPAGSVTVVTGHTGSGKSTLGLVLAGLLSPDTGTVRVDGGSALPRAAATLIPQHTALLHGTIRDNLLFARDGVSQAELDRVLDTVRLGSLITASRHGWDTSIGENGLQLSGGERQRLGIARALLADCRLLVVDEATSALDQHTADRVTEALREHCRDKTLVLIAHRLPRLEPQDRVIVLDRGRVAEHGTHGLLSRAGGAYASLLAAQPVARPARREPPHPEPPRRAPELPLRTT
ncbi:ABC transporter ATP-binding protein [Micromonospora chokoriensis]|uniref:ATP-binding cassette, subfamily B n=1 Tax=Micromonospora chokoriensis TaxID=356851 RepID=A0A1C4UKY0_9ACTN|nr:ABC transporter ATP-binding protein [Micromonospora chokoriensis]SCE72307.1 ATP-binding cassette, subfamily B [Micromonospora chokoriensis]